MATITYPARTAEEKAAPARRGDLAGWLPAVAAWALLVPLALAAPGLTGLGSHSLRGAMLPLVVGAVAALLVLAAMRWADVTALSVGVFAAWTALVMRAALHGTPFGFNGLYGDMARMSAMATRYSATAASSDGIVAGVPSEYPFLYPWLIGRTAALLGTEAWRLLAEAEIIVTSFAVVAAFLLWRRLVAAPVALAVAVAGFAVFHSPWKAFEVLALGVTVPWLLLAFGAPPRGRLHWVPAGVVGGLLIFTYQGYLLYGAAGIVGLVVLTWRAAADRAAYLRHVCAVAGLSALVAAPYLIPYLGGLLRGGQVVADLYETFEIAANPFPFLTLSVLGLLQLTGLAGLVWFRRAVWWAPPLLVLVLGSYAYRLLCALRFLIDGHTGMIHHAAVLTDYLLAVAGVLTLVRAVPVVVRRLGAVPPARTGAGALGALMAWTAVLCWAGWMPKTGMHMSAAQTARAYAEPPPTGPRPGNQGRSWFPVVPVRAAVEARLGPGARPRTLAYDERLFAYLPWQGYIAVDRTAALSPTRWDDRFAELDRLSRMTAPAAFGRESAATAFGSIDVFVLRQDVDGAWTWRPLHFGRAVRFRPGQFDRGTFDVVTGLPGRTVVAVRIPRPGR